MKWFTFILTKCLLSNATPSSYVISNFAGNGVSSTAGDNGKATSASIAGVCSSYSDTLGVTYLTDCATRIRKVDSNDIITTFGGGSSSGHEGEDGPISSATFTSSYGIWGDTVGRIFVIDVDGLYCRVVDASGIVSRYAGYGQFGSSGDGGQATSATMSEPQFIFGNSVGSLFISDDIVNKIRIVSDDGIITTFAGSGSVPYSGDGGPATSTNIDGPLGIGVSTTGVLFIAELNSARIRMVNAGIITTVAGTGSFSYNGDGIPATAAEIDNPVGVVVDADLNVFFADFAAYRVRTINNGLIYTVGGVGTGASDTGDGGMATAADMLHPWCLSEGLSGSLVVGIVNHFRKLSSLAPTANPTPAPTSSMAPSTMAPSTRSPTIAPSVSYLGPYYQVLEAGTGSGGSGADGVAASSSSLYSPYQMWYSSDSSISGLLISEYQSLKIRKVSTNGIVSTFAGSSTASNTAAGLPATASYLNSPTGVCADDSGNVYVTLYGGKKIMKFSATTFLSSGYAGTGTQSPTATDANGDGYAASSATFNQPYMMACASFVVYIADASNNKIRAISASGIISTVAGTGSTALSSSTMAATSASVYHPTGVFVDASGKIFIAEQNGNYLKVVTNGLISLLGGNGNAGTGTDGGSATNSKLNIPTGIFGDGAGNTFFSDQNNMRARVIDTNGIITTFCGTGSSPSSSSTSGPASSTNVAQPAGMHVDSTGAVHISDLSGSTVRRVYSIAPTSAPSYSCRPTVQPTLTPSVSFYPSVVPTIVPTTVPSSAPTLCPSVLPSTSPTQVPSKIPTACPTIEPTSLPSMCPTTVPSLVPSTEPTTAPTLGPTTHCPTMLPSGAPTLVPSVSPSVIPTVTPTMVPSQSPSLCPSVVPSVCPSVAPSLSPSAVPSDLPSQAPSLIPTLSPTRCPSLLPSAVPTLQPSESPSMEPSRAPSSSPTLGPTCSPSAVPTTIPSVDPSVSPSMFPTFTSSCSPTQAPTFVPSVVPSTHPSSIPSMVPSTAPTDGPSINPTELPSVLPSGSPSIIPTGLPSVRPTMAPTMAPTSSPSSAPTLCPTCCPSAAPTYLPSYGPSMFPSEIPSVHPILSPSVPPSIRPTDSPSTMPTDDPSLVPTALPSTPPSMAPSNAPSVLPTRLPSVVPTRAPTCGPSMKPTLLPSRQPSIVPSLVPSVAAPSVSAVPTRPTVKPTRVPTFMPTLKPTRSPTLKATISPTAPTERPSVTFPPTLSDEPTLLPSEASTAVPSAEPLIAPSCSPSIVPSALPTRTPTTVLPSSTAPSVAPSTLEYYIAHPKATLPSNRSISVVGVPGLSFKIVLPFLSMSSGPSGNAFDNIEFPAATDPSFTVFSVPTGSSLSNIADAQRFGSAGGYDTSKRSVSLLNDINDDSFDDLIIGDPYASKCYVMFGSELGLVSMSTGFTIFGESEGDLTGWSVSGAGDMNNDILPDIIIGAPNAKGVGAMYVVYGRRSNNFDVYLSNLTSFQGFALYGMRASDFLGISVSGVGDFNGDHCDDVIVGAIITSSYFSGAAFVVYGGRSLVSLSSSSLSSASLGFKVSGVGYQYAGYSVSGAGDFNKDGLLDVIVGTAPQRSSLSAAAYIIYGSRSIGSGIALASLSFAQGVRINGAGSVVAYSGGMNVLVYGGGFNDVPITSGFVVFTNTSFMTKLTFHPSLAPSVMPTKTPTKAPLVPTVVPTKLPSVCPSVMPSSPTFDPTPGVSQPSSLPSSRPTFPTIAPSLAPSEVPTVTPSESPTEAPTTVPSEYPSESPSVHPTAYPSAEPTFVPTCGPSSVEPTVIEMTRVPYTRPSLMPTVHSTSIVYTVYVIVDNATVIDETEGYRNYIVNTSDSVTVDNAKGNNKYSLFPREGTIVTIRHFNTSNDVIDLTLFESIGKFKDLILTEGSVIVNLPHSQTIHILNLHPLDMSSTNFLFRLNTASTTENETKVVKTLSVVAAVLIGVGGCTCLIFMCCHFYGSISLLHKHDSGYARSHVLYQRW